MSSSFLQERSLVAEMKPVPITRIIYVDNCADISRIASVRSRETKDIADEVKFQRYGQSASSAGSVFGVLARTDGAGAFVIELELGNGDFYHESSDDFDPGGGRVQAAATSCTIKTKT
ncbi:hypothetical protein LSAT2_017066 [Lamellibrachia satsuma]|nr:hypothetical protein LSAT2_017066 [Lamellibrachia satsuma]